MSIKNIHILQQVYLQIIIKKSVSDEERLKHSEYTVQSAGTQQQPVNTGQGVYGLSNWIIRPQSPEYVPVKEKMVITWIEPYSKPLTLQQCDRYLKINENKMLYMYMLWNTMVGQSKWLADKDIHSRKQSQGCSRDPQEKWVVETSPTGRGGEGTQEPWDRQGSCTLIQTFSNLM